MVLRISDDDTQLNPGQIDADRRFGDIAKIEEKGTFDDITSPENMAKDGVSGDLSGQARDAEDTPPGGWANKTGDASSQSPKQAGFLIRGKPRRGPLIGIIISLLIGGGGVGFFLAPVLGPIAFIENITDDLNDQLGALNVREGYVFRNKIPSSDRQKALTGCTKISIRCKFATVNEKQIARLKASGIEATSKSPSGLWGKRIKPDNYRFQGVDYSPTEWANQLKTNPKAQHAQRKANNMKFLGTRSPAFNRTLAKFGVSLRPPELKGSAVDRVNALLNKAGAASPTDLVFKPSDDVDENGKPKSYTLEGDTSNKSYTPAEVETMKGSIARVANARPPSRATKASIGALSVLGYWDLACSIKNMLVGATVAAKIANQAELIAWFMPIATLVGKIKSGEATPEEAEAVGLFFNQTDNRQKLVDIEKSITNTSESGIEINSVLDETLDNPNYGKSAMDASLLQMSINGGIAPPSTTRSQFSLGLGNNALLAGISGFADILNIVVNVGDASMCRWIQNPITRIVGGIVGVAAAVGSGGTSFAIQSIVAAGMMAAMMVLDTIINNALQGSLVDSADFESTTVERGEAGWTAMSGLLGSSAQQNGLMPGTSEAIVEYAQVQNQVKQEYIALEASEANQLDIYNQYSFVGSFARSIMGYSSSSVSVGSFFGNIASIVGGGMLSFTKPYTAYAATIDESRFKQCDDSSYQALGIDADVQCNVRYVMPTEDLALDTDEVAIWMEDTGQVAKDTVTGLPVGYTVPEPAQSQGLALDFITGIVDTALNTKPLPNEYAKFLEYCVYRTMPFGETGEETSAINDEEPEWKTGENCMKRGAPYNYFRIYTLDKSVQESIDGDVVQETVDGSKQALAQEIIDSPNVSYYDGDNGTNASGELISIKEQIQAIADGSSDGNTAPCQVNIAILQIISALIGAGHTLTISDINRDCVNSSLNSTFSPHWTGNAIDISVFDGVNTTDLAATNAVLDIAVQYMPAGSMIGIVGACNPGIPGLFQGFQVFDDPGSCGHLHIGMPLGSDPEYIK